MKPRYFVLFGAFIGASLFLLLGAAPDPDLGHMPPFTVNAKTNIWSDNGTAPTFNGSVIGGSGGTVGTLINTTATAAGNLIKFTGTDKTNTAPASATDVFNALPNPIPSLAVSSLSVTGMTANIVPITIADKSFAPSRTTTNELDFIHLVPTNLVLQSGFTGYATASLPTGVAVGFTTYCTDCLTPWGTGSLVNWSSDSSWRTPSMRFLATTDPVTFILSGVTNAFSFHTALIDADFFAVGSSQLTYPLGRTTANSGTGAGITIPSAANAVGVQIAYNAGSSGTGVARAYGSFWNSIQSGDTYAMGGQYAVSAGSASSSDNYIAFIGFKSTITSNYVVNGCYFLADTYNVTAHNQAYTNNWICVTAASSSYTYKDSGIAIRASSTAYDRLAILATSSAVVFYGNGVSVATNTTTIPTTTLYANSVEMLKNTGATGVSLYETAPWYHIRRGSAHTY